MGGWVGVGRRVGREGKGRGGEGCEVQSKARRGPQKPDPTHLKDVVGVKLVDPVEHVVEVRRARLGRQHELDARAALEALQLEVVALQLLDARGGERGDLRIWVMILGDLKVG